MKRKLLLGLYSFSLFQAMQLFGQVSTPASPEPVKEADKEVLKLSPFIVSNEGSQGYRSQQTMVGSRSAKNLIDLPVSAALINREQIDDLGALSLSDALRYSVSGVTQNQSFNDDINIRGFRAGSPLRNGVERSTGLDFGPNKSMPLYDIERIEVLKGPAAMLNGSNGGIGGSINYVSRQPTPSLRGEVQVAVADNSSVRLQANLSGPLVSSNGFSLNYRVTLGALRGNAPHGKPIEWQDQKFVSTAFAMYFGTTSSLTVNASYFVDNDYLYLEDFLDISVPVDPVTGLSEARFNRYSTQGYAPGRKEDAFWPYKTAFIDATYIAKLTENGNLRAVLAHGWNDDNRRNNRGITVRPDNYTLDRQDIRNHSGEENYSGQVDYIHRLPLKWLTLESTLGADASVSKYWANQSIGFMPAIDTRTGLYPDDTAWFAQFPNDTAYFFTPRSSTIGLPQTRLKTNVTSSSYYFMEHASFWKERISLIYGLRWFSTGGTNENLVTNVTTKRDENTFRVHKYGIMFKVLPSVSVYVTDAQNVFPAARGFTDKFIGADAAGEPFKDSLGKLREAGVKFDYKVSDKISAYGSVAAFKMEQTNIRTLGVLPQGNPPGAIGTIQSAKDSAKGWEADVGVQLMTANGRADVLLTYFNGDSAIAADEGKPYVKQTVNFVPEKFSFLGKYTWNSGTLKGLRIGGGFETEAAKRNGNFTIDHPLLADAFAGYAVNKHWDIQLNLSNLTNERYIIQVAATGLVQASDTFRAKLTVEYKW